MSLYPIFLKLNYIPCLVVGGGKVAARKVKALLAAGAEITVLAPELSRELEKMAGDGVIIHLKRDYQSEDLIGFVLVIASTDAGEVNQRIYNDAVQNNVLINSVDDPERSNFYVPSLLKRGKLLLAISTSGTVPYFARELRKFLESKFYPGIEKDLAGLQKLRSEIIEGAKGNGKLKEEKFEQVLKPKIEEIFQKMDGK